jgi:(E)-2-((N-methylformamido)methylene)succinate hydrolase
VTTFARPGLVTHYAVEGTGPPLLLIHGVGARLDSWDDVVAALGGRFTTIRYDLRGHGDSTKVPGPYSVELFAADAVALLDHLGIARCHVAGFSLGGLVAQRLALDAPGRVAGLVLLSTVAGRTDEEQRRVLERLALVEHGIPGEHFRRSLERWFSDEFRRRHPDVLERYAARNMENDPACYAAAYRVLAMTDLADELHRIQAPTLVVTGEGDVGSNPRMATLMHGAIPGSRLQILPGLRHSILTEAPAQVAHLLEEFLSGQPLPGGETAMSKPNPVPQGYPRLTPYLVVDGAAKALDFYARVFGATEQMRMPGPGGKIGHAEIRLGDSVVMLADEHPEMGIRAPRAFGGTPVSLMLYVEDVDATVKRALAAGAKLLRPVEDKFYGDRSGTIEDPFGHHWHVSTHVEDVPPEELARRAAALAKPS